VASRAQLDRVQGYYDMASRLGDIIDLGCPRHACDPRGYYVSPSVVVGLAPGSPISREEVFGPLLTIEPFDDIDHAIALANDTPFGLSASIWTARADLGYRLARGIESGGVSVYASIAAAAQAGPELGTSRYFEPRKQSGMGVDGGLPGFLSYTSAQSVYFFN
jgi:acyl-CoA reductase-like NAD-dependent aldehyde dehydrogenase